MTSDLELNLNPAVERDFRDLLRERGFASINEFIIDTLKSDRANKRRVELESVSQRMWPNGDPTGRGKS